MNFTRRTSNYLINEPCIVVGRKGSSGAVNYVASPCWPIDTTYFVSATRSLSLDYLYILLRVLRLDRFDRCTAIPGLNRADAYALTVPVPPLAEQKRIVAKVDQLMAFCHDLEARQTKKREVGTRLTKSALEALTTAEGPEEFDAAWKRVVENFDVLIDRAETIRNLRGTILALAASGRLCSPSTAPAPSVPQGDSYKPDFLVPRGWTWSSLGALCKFIEYRGRMTRGLPQVGDVLFTTEAPLGNVAQLLTAEKIAPSLRIITLRPVPDVNPAFLMTLLMSPQLQASISGKATGMTALRIKAAKLKLIPFPVPSLDEQSRIVQRVGELMALCDDLEARLVQAVERAARLAEAVVSEMIASGAR